MIPRPYPRPAGADIGANNTREPEYRSPCDCQDDQLDAMVALAQSVGQWEASRAIWGGAA